MVSAGGAFAEAIFLAYNKAVKSGLSARDGGGGVRIKREPDDGMDMGGGDEGMDEGERARKRARVGSEGVGEGGGDAI